jgi:hypothetical protein
MLKFASVKTSDLPSSMMEEEGEGALGVVTGRELERAVGRSRRNRDSIRWIRGELQELDVACAESSARVWETTVQVREHQDLLERHEARIDSQDGQLDSFWTGCIVSGAVGAALTALVGGLCFFTEPKKGGLSDDQIDDLVDNSAFRRKVAEKVAPLLAVEVGKSLKKDVEFIRAVSGAVTGDYQFKSSVEAAVSASRSSSDLEELKKMLESIEEESK